MRRHKAKKSCHKIAFYDKPAARQALREAKDIGCTRFYKCPHCSTKEKPIFHLTSKGTKNG